MRNALRTLVLLFMVFGITQTFGQLYSYTNNLGGAPASVAANASGTSLTRVNGATLITGCPDGFNSNRFSDNTFYTSLRPAVEFTVSPAAGYQLNVTSLSVDARRNNKGPVSWRLAYSIDGGASWIDNGSDYTVSAVACGTNNTLTWNIPDFGTAGSVSVRIYAFFANSTLNGVATMRNITLGGFTSFADVDGDGYTSNVDCDDFNSAVNLGATEVCNEIDDNCNGTIDEGVQSTFYADADSDGFGDAGTVAMACSAPAGYVTDNTDCNDGNSAVNPAASEVCNGTDDDCNGLADDGLPFDTWYADADGDGYGDAGTVAITCDGAPAGYVADATDCNDANAAVNPGASEVCNGIDDDCSGIADDGLTFNTWYADADGDGYGDAAMSTSTCDGAPAGYVADATDCNDANAAVNPGATEVCNGIDDNCDGNIDEGVQSTFYADADGDGYGNAASATLACSAPAGYVSDATDCNDANGAVNPGATEVCNGIDDNCDGNIDEGVQSTFYADADGDGYGNAASTTLACSAPAGYVSDATDCNDANGAVNPGATEVCNGIDDNCDGNIDEGVQSTFYADADGDGYGDAASTTLACSVPAGYSANATDCNDANGSVNPGATEVCNGIDDNCNGNIDEGVQSTFYADADGDGYGNAASTTLACSVPAGYSANATDCNDANGSVNPGAAEICNGIDDNCNGSVDEGVLITFYADADGDGYGNAGVSTAACSAPAGYVASSTDCNDASATVYPGAPEICGNGIDEDCDGVIDLTATIAAGGPTTICIGNSVTLNSTTAGAGLSYQWQKNGNNIAGATNASYVVTLQGNYRCVVTKPSCSSTSAPITVNVLLNPAANITALDGLNLCGKPYVRLKANTGTGLTYQWFKDGSSIAGATAVTYFATTTGSYYVRVTNATGCSTNSAAVTVFTSCRTAEGAEFSEINLMPNPTKGAFDMVFTTNTTDAATARVMVMNLAGQVVESIDAEVVGGQMNVHFDMQPVAGAYLVVVQMNGATYTERLMIVE